jgi:hypothetical protein
LVATDPTRWSNDRRARVGELFDLLANAPEGITVYKIADELDVPLATARTAIRDIRVEFASSDINVTAQPNGQRQPWLYRLTASYKEAQPWFQNRTDDLGARLETIESIAASISSGARHGTVEWKKARKVYRTVHYLREELAVIDGEYPSP